MAVSVLCCDPNWTSWFVVREGKNPKAESGSSSRSAR